MQMTQTPSTSMQSKWLEPCLKRGDGPAINLMEHLFSRMDGLYPGRWRNNYPSPQSLLDWQEAWSEGFAEDRVDPRELKEGIANCRRLYDWPPSYKEFLRACRPYTEPETAYREAVAGMTARKSGQVGVWSHPAVYWAAVRVGQHDLLNANWSVLKSRWEEVLRTELARAEWAPVPAPAAALPAPGAAVSTREEGARQVAGLLSQAVQPKTGDPKAWARRLLSDTRRASPAMISMAKAALEIGQYEEHRA